MRVSISIFILAFCWNVFAFELIAHRGVHQTYHRKNLTDRTCTATRIDQTGHEFIENTLESIEHSFNLGATMVELDVHPTTEKKGDEQLVVFHDWTLNCRTEASCENGCDCNSHKVCVTNEQPLSYLQKLDLGHGYTFNQGNSYPLRGKFVGKMPTLEQTLSLLAKYPGKKLLINVKGNSQRTVQAFLRIIERYPESIRTRVFYPYIYGRAQELKKFSVKDAIYQAPKKCYKKYLLVGWLGIFPKECHNLEIMVPIRETMGRLHSSLNSIKFISVLWGWPHRFIRKANKHGTKVYASQVDTLEEYQEMRKLPLSGIMTNKIELLAPHFKKN